MVQGSDFRKFKSRFLPRSSDASEIHSSAVCACAMSPGPNTTLGMPPAASTAASQKKSTPAGFDWPTLRKNCRTSGSLGIGFQRQARRQLRAGNHCGQIFRAQERGDFTANAGFRLPRQRPPVNRNDATVGNDVRLCAAGNRADIHSCRAEQRMCSFPQPRGVIRFERAHDARHFVNGILAKLWRRAVRRLAARFESQPQAAFVRGDHLQPGRLADNGQGGGGPPAAVRPSQAGHLNQLRP